MSKCEEVRSLEDHPNAVCSAVFAACCSFDQSFHVSWVTLGYCFLASYSCLPMAIEASSCLPEVKDDSVSQNGSLKAGKTQFPGYPSPS